MNGITSGSYRRGAIGGSSPPRLLVSQRSNSSAWCSHPHFCTRFHAVVSKWPLPTPPGKKVHIRDSYSYLLTVVDGLEVGLQMGFAVIHVDGDAIERGQPGHVSRGI